MNMFYKKSLLLNVLLLPLILLSVLFRYVTSLRRRFYQRGIIASYGSSVPVISVGNITVGGTGKTPMVIHLCRLFNKSRVAVVSRGYGSGGHGARIVSDGERLLTEPRRCPGLYGDEPCLIAKSVTNAIVAVGENKAGVIRLLEREYKPDIILLDDGFSHLRVKRDLDIVLVDGQRGFGNGHLLPAGPLREPMDSLRYADIVGIKGGNGTDVPWLDAIGLRDRTFAFDYRFDGLRTIQGDADVPIGSIRNKKVVCIAGIALPAGFFDMLHVLGITPAACVAMPDHYRYDASGLGTITRRYEPEVVIVTAKDAVKLAGIERDNAILWTYADIAVREEGGVLRDMLRKKGFLQ